MTKPRMPETFQFAAMKVIGELTPPVAAAIVGRSEGHVARWTDHDSTTAVPVDFAVQLDIAYVQARPEVGMEGAPIYALYRRLIEQALGGLPRPAPMAPTARVMQIMAEAGDVPRLLHDCMQDAEITPAEATRLAQAGGEAVEQLLAFVEEMKVIARRGAAKP